MLNIKIWITNTIQLPIKKQSIVDKYAIYVACTSLFETTSNCHGIESMALWLLQRPCFVYYFIVFWLFLMKEQVMTRTHDKNSTQETQKHWERERELMQLGYGHGYVRVSSRPGSDIDWPGLRYYTHPTATPDPTKGQPAWVASPFQVQVWIQHIPDPTPSSLFGLS